MRIRRYLRELYDQPQVALSLKIRMVKADRGPPVWMTYYVEPPLGTLLLRTVHHRVLLHTIGAHRKRPDHRMTSYNRALEIARSWSAEQGKKNTRKSLAAYPPHTLLVIISIY